MKFIDQKFEIISTDFNREYVLSRIEKAARVCYQSEGKICEGSDVRILKMLLSNGHEAMIEHAPNLSVLFTLDRAIANELVRHRLFSFAQESTRYVRYDPDRCPDGQIEFIVPNNLSEEEKQLLMSRNWNEDCLEDYPQLSLAARMCIVAYSSAEYAYRTLLSECKWKSEAARDVLNLDLKTQLLITGNVREWRNCFKLRTAKDAHPKLRELMSSLLKTLHDDIPELWEDLI